jgi:hypothetical protein
VTPSPTPLPPLIFENVSYAHPDGLFTLRPPQAWISTDGEGFVTFNAPDYFAGFLLQVTNTVYLLEDNAFAQFATARDENVFNSYANLSQVAIDFNYAENEITITNEISDEENTTRIHSVYKRVDHAIFMFEFWTEDVLFEHLLVQIERLFDEVNISIEAANSLPTYHWVYRFEGAEGLFSFEVPTSWKYIKIRRDLTEVDRFEAPDEHAIIESITYYNDEELTKSQAGLLARSILSNQFLDDIAIIDDQVQLDGSERYTWISYSMDISGKTFFDLRGMTFIMYTVKYDNSHEDLYREVLEHSINSYIISQ